MKKYANHIFRVKCKTKQETLVLHVAVTAKNKLVNNKKGRHAGRQTDRQRTDRQADWN